MMNLSCSARRWALALGVGAALIGLAVAEPSEAAPPEAKPSSEIDPKAIAQLQRMKQSLRRLTSFTVNAATTKDEIVHGDFKVQRTANVRILARSPDRLRAEVSGDDGDMLYVYDGRSLALETWKTNTYATMPAPATLRETLDAAMTRHDLELPLVDILYTASGGEIAGKILAAGDLGPSQVGGVSCEWVAIRTKAVDWQICVEHGERALPRKLVLTTRDSPFGLQSSVVLDWDVKTRIPDAAFTFQPSEGAMRIAFAPAVPKRAEPR